MSNSRLKPLASIYFVEIYNTPGIGPVESAGWYLAPVAYLEHCKSLFAEDGSANPWTITGNPTTKYMETESGEGTVSWHAYASLPGTFEIATWPGDADPEDDPTSVDHFDFTGHEIGPLPVISYALSELEGPLPVQQWRFWPGRSAAYRPV